MPSSSTTPLVAMRNIHVTYEDVEALNGVDFDLYPGEIHAVIGEHRAGKSTLVKLLSGSARKSRGTIYYKGEPVESFTPASSLKAGIGMVYQETTVIPAVNAIENIYTGQMVRNWFGRLSKRKMEQYVLEAKDKLGVELDIYKPLHRLTPAQQHMVEFLRAVIMEPAVVIIDELANKLTPAEMQQIYRALLVARQDGAGIIYISHDLDEVLKLADRVTILRNGYRRGTEYASNLDKYRLFQLTYSFSLDSERLEHSRMKFLLMKRYYQNIVNHLPVGIVILDPENRVQLTNVLLSETVGGSSEAALEIEIENILERFPEESARRILEAIESRTEISLREIELNNEKIVNAKVVPLSDENGASLGVSLLFEDVSLQRSLQSYLIESEKMNSVAEVAVGVAHEINNPLFIIKNYLQVMLETTNDEAVRSKLEKIEKEAGRIMETVSSLLSFSRVRQNRTITANLKQVVQEVITLVHHHARKKSISVVADLGAESVMVQGEENKLKQVAMNLIMNSIEAVLTNGTVEVRITSSKDEGVHELTVRDNGYGIPDDVAASIFDPFFSTKVTKKNTGLGLSICKTIVEDFGGSIEYRSTPGQFTEFIVALPVAD